MELILELVLHANDGIVPPLFIGLHIEVKKFKKIDFNTKV